MRLDDFLPRAFHYVFIVQVSLDALIEVGDLTRHGRLLDVVQVYHGDCWVCFTALVINSYLTNRLRLPLQIKLVQPICHEQTRPLMQVHINSARARIRQIVVIIVFIMCFVMLYDPLTYSAEIVFLGVDSLGVLLVQ